MSQKKQIKVAYFPATSDKNTVINKNGKSMDQYCTKCEIEEDLSTGNYLLDATFIIKDDLTDLLQEEAILKVLADYGEEVFRISKVIEGTKYIDIVARQITIADSLTLFLKDTRPTNLNGQAALSWILSNAEGTKEITLKSDISSLNTAYYIDKNMYEALHDSDNCFIKRWKGEVQRRGYIETINARIGVNRGFVIREGKNLTGFECTSNIDKLVTRAKGKGFDGLEGDYVDSPIINHYNRVYTKVIEYSDVKVKDEYSDDGFETEREAKDELNRLIKNEFENNDIDKIQASYRINFVQLEKTEEYKNYIVAERLYIGDTIRVYIPRIGVDIDVRAMTKKYNVLTQRTKEVTLSNYVETKPLSIKEIMDKLDGLKEQNNSALQEAKKYASELIKGGLKNSYVIVRENEIIIGDTQDVNTMTNVWRWNKNGLGFSSTGYYGEFGLAMTIDGHIVADFITVGILNANLIKAGVLTNEKGNFLINMETGEFKFASEDEENGARFDKEGLSIFRNNVRSILMNNGRMNLFNSLTGANMGYFGTVGNDLRVQLLASNTFSVFAGSDNLKVLSIDVNRDLRYGNAMMDICGGIVFTQKPGQDVGFNAIVLGNDDRHDAYGFHNLSVRCHNSLGFQDNNGLTHMFFDVRNGNIVMKGQVYENCLTPPNAYALDLGARSSSIYESGIEKKEVIDAILEAPINVSVNSKGEYRPSMNFIESDLLTTIIDEQRHTDGNSLIASLITTVQDLNNRILELEKR